MQEVYYEMQLVTYTSSGEDFIAGKQCQEEQVKDYDNLSSVRNERQEENEIHVALGDIHVLCDLD